MTFPIDARTWKRFGRIASTMSCGFRQRNTLCCWPRHLWTPRPTVNAWPKSCLRHSMCLPCTFPSKRFSRYIPPGEPLVSFWTVVMEFLTQFPSMKLVGEFHIFLCLFSCLNAMSFSHGAAYFFIGIIRDRETINVLGHCKSASTQPLRCAYHTLYTHFLIFLDGPNRPA